MRYFLPLLILLLQGCAAPKFINFSERAEVRGKVIHTGIIECFDEGLTYDNQTPVYCEASAALLIGDKILLATDKPVPGEKRSPVFTIPVDQLKSKSIGRDKVSYVSSEVFRQMQKIEAFAHDGGKVFFASTAFDRVRSTPEWDTYNSLVSWSEADFSDAFYLLPTQNGDMVSSRLLRQAFQRALRNDEFPEGPPYFKIEALAVLPGNRLIFGVREIGKSFQNFTYTCTLIETTFETSLSGVRLMPEFRKIYEFAPEVNGRRLGVSDLAYYPAGNSLLVLTSYEADGDEKTKAMASCLWALPLARMANGEKPMLVKNADNTPLEIPYKGEGLCVLNGRTVFIVHDEDRKESSLTIEGRTVVKKPHQTIYSIVEFK